MRARTHARRRAASSAEELEESGRALLENRLREAGRAYQLARRGVVLLDEGRIAASVRHPNVVRTLDVGEDGDALYLVMEWIEGVTLERMARAATAAGGALAPGIAVRAVADVCAGLHAAHELVDDAGVPRVVVHRDVSPDNVLVTGDGVPKLADFGIARSRDRLAGDTSLGRFKGKPGYTAPEQALRRKIDRRVDVWGAGALLFRLLAGVPPFANLDELAELINGARDVPALQGDLPPSIDACVRRALERDPNARFQTALDLSRALDAIAITLPRSTTRDIVDEVKRLRE